MRISAVPELLWLPVLKRKIIPSGDQLSEGSQSNSRRPYNSTDHSLFPCVEPVSKSSWICLYTTRPGVVPTHQTNGPWQGPGVHPSSRRPWRKAMCCWPSMKCGTFPKASKASLPSTSTLGLKSKRRPVGGRWVVPPSNNKPNIRTTTSRGRESGWITTKCNTIPDVAPWPRWCSTPCGVKLASAYKQDPSPGIPRAPTLPQVPGQWSKPHSLCEPLDQGPRGSALHQARPLRVVVSQPQHLPGMLHHLLGTAPSLWGLRATGRSAPLFRHGLGGVCAPARSSQSSFGAVFWWV